MVDVPKAASSWKCLFVCLFPGTIWRVQESVCFRWRDRPHDPDWQVGPFLSRLLAGTAVRPRELHTRPASCRRVGHAHKDFTRIHTMTYSDVQLLCKFIFFIACSMVVVCVCVRGNLKNHLVLLSKTADSICDGDLVDRQIRSRQTWSLLPTQVHTHSVPLCVNEQQLRLDLFITSSGGQVINSLANALGKCALISPYITSSGYY